MTAWLGKKIFGEILSRDYQSIENSPSSEYVNILTNALNLISISISSIFRFFASSLTLIAILFVLFMQDFATALPLFVLISLNYLVIILKGTSSVKETSKENLRLSELILNRLKETFGSIRYIKISNTQEMFAAVYNKLNAKLRQNQAKIAFYQQKPRYTVSSALLIIIIGIASFRLIYSEKPDEALLEIFTVLIGCARLVTPMQVLFVNYSKISEAIPSFKLIHPYIQSIANTDMNLKNLPLEIRLEDKLKHLTLSNVFYKYNNCSTDFGVSIDLKVNKGDKIAIIGKSGSGKSTIMDLMMGLLLPTNGTVSYNNVSLENTNIFQYHRKITHVPQIPFLLDDSLVNNICFSFTSENVDLQKVYEVMRLACIEELIPYLDTDASIGEDGSKLSGGQRQRLAIARGLYNISEILFLDEATSALDEATEKLILSNIFHYYNNLTLISITHRLETLNLYDKAFEVKNGIGKCIAL